MERRSLISLATAATLVQKHFNYCESPRWRIFDIISLNNLHAVVRCCHGDDTRGTRFSPCATSKVTRASEISVEILIGNIINRGHTATARAQNKFARARVSVCALLRSPCCLTARTNLFLFFTPRHHRRRHLSALIGFLLAPTAWHHSRWLLCVART